MIRARVRQCPDCDGTGLGPEIQIGGDGYGGRCCALADVPSQCPRCKGTGVIAEEESD